MRKPFNDEMLNAMINLMDMIALNDDRAIAEATDKARSLLVDECKHQFIRGVFTLGGENYNIECAKCRKVIQENIPNGEPADEKFGAPSMGFKLASYQNPASGGEAFLNYDDELKTYNPKTHFTIPLIWSEEQKHMVFQLFKDISLLNSETADDFIYELKGAITKVFANKED